MPCSRWICTVAMILAFGATAPALHAQALTAAPAVPAAPAPLGPTFDAARAGVRTPIRVQAAYSTADENAAVAARARMGKSVALMIVGGAALVTGAIIGGAPGALVAVAGAGVGLYGLYLYLQ